MAMNVHWVWASLAGVGLLLSSASPSVALMLSYEPPGIRPTSHVADVIAVIRVTHVMRRGIAPHTPSCPHRVDFGFEWVEQWYRSPFIYEDDSMKTCTLEACWPITPRSPVGEYLAFLRQNAPGVYEQMGFCTLRLDKNRQVRGVPLWDIPVLGRYEKRERLTLEQARALVKTYVIPDQRQTYDVWRYERGDLRWKWDSKAPYQRVWFRTLDPPAPPWPRRSLYSLVGYVRTACFSESVRASRVLGKELKHKDGRMPHCRIEGRWVSGSLLIEQIVDLETGANLFSEGCGASQTGENSAGGEDEATVP